MQVHQALSEAADQRCRRGRTVHPGPIAAGPHDFPAQDQPTVVDRDPLRFALADQFGDVAAVEHPLDQGPVFSGPYDLLGSPLSEEKRQGADDERLAGSRLSRKHIETRR